MTVERLEVTVERIEVTIERLEVTAERLEVIAETQGDDLREHVTTEDLRITVKKHSATLNSKH